MNIALPALIVFILLLPGFTFRSRFKRAEKTSLDYSPFGQVVIEALAWAACLHALWLFVAAVILGQHLQFPLLLGLMSSDPATQSRAIAEVGTRGAQVAAYFGSLLLVSFVLPTIARRFVMHRRLDRQAGVLSDVVRFHAAPWYYLLTGADFDEEEVPDLIQLSAIVEIAGEAMLYTGVLEDFFVGEDGQLDRVVLSAAMRRPLRADKTGPADESAGHVTDQRGIQVPEPNRFYQIDSDYFVLRYSEMITLNIQYHRFERQDVVAEDESA